MPQRGKTPKWGTQFDFAIQGRSGDERDHTARVVAPVALHEPLPFADATSPLNSVAAFVASRRAKALQCKVFL